MSTEIISTASKVRGDRTPKLELESRVLKVVSMIEEGRSRTEILTTCITDYGVSRSTADRYIETANDQFKEAYKPQLKRSAEIAKRRLESIFQKSMLKEQFRTALLAQTQLNKIQGLCDDDLMAGIRVESTSPGGIF